MAKPPSNRPSKKEGRSNPTSVPDAPRRRFPLKVRLVAALALLALIWIIAGFLLDAAVERALARRELTTALRWARTAQWLRPFDRKLRLTPVRAARLAGDVEAWTSKIEPFADQSESPEVKRELQLGRILTGDFPANANELMGGLLLSGPPSETAEAFILGHLVRQERDQARSILLAWKGDEPDNPQTEYVEALFQGFTGNREEAAMRLARFSAAHPEHQPARLRLGEMKLASNQFAAALEDFQTLVDQDYVEPSVLLRLAICRRQLGESDQAKAILAPLLDQLPPSDQGPYALVRTQVLRELATCELELGEYASAAKHFREGGVTELLPIEQAELALAEYMAGNDAAAQEIYDAIAARRKAIGRRADLENYLALHPDDEAAKQELAELDPSP